MHLFGIMPPQSTSPNKAKQRIQWSSKLLEHTIGRGVSAADTFRVSFVSNDQLDNVELWIVPELRPFVRVTPSRFDEIPAGESREVVVRFLVAPRAEPRSYEGTIHLRAGGKRTIPSPLEVRLTVDYGGVVVAPSTQVLTEEAGELITRLAPEESLLEFGAVTPEIAALQPGHVLVLGPSPQTPMGLLCKVLSTSPSEGGGLRIEMGPATLEEVFEAVDLGIDVPLLDDPAQNPPRPVRGQTLQADGPRRDLGDPSIEQPKEIIKEWVFDKDNDPTTTSDQIKGFCKLEIKSYLHCDYKIENGALQRLSFSARTTPELSIRVYVPFMEQEFKPPSRQFLKYPFARLVFYAGFVPIVLTPCFELEGTFKAEAKAELGVGVKFSTDASARIEYTEGGWKTSKQCTLEPNWDTIPSIVAMEAEARADLAGSLVFYIYQVVGPFLRLNPYVEASVSPAEWSLNAGFDAMFGAKLSGLWQREGLDDPAILLVEWKKPILSGIFSKGTVVVGVCDAVTPDRPVPLSGVEVKVYDSERRLVRAELTPANGTLRMELPAGKDGCKYKLEFYKEGYIPESYDEVEVKPLVERTLAMVLKVPTQFAGNSTIHGTIRDAIHARGVHGLSLDVRRGIQATTGEIVTSTATSIGGQYRLSDMPGGNYTITARGPGYIPVTFTVLSIGGKDYGEQDAIITPVLPSHETRVVLTWGSKPSDLDGHLTGPLEDGTRFHMYYRYSDEANRNPWPGVVCLDRDDISSWGPETITLLQQSTGVYRYYVHDYTNADSTFSYALGMSNAQVRVYRGSKLVEAFHVPLDKQGTLWCVFEMDGDEIRPINELCYVPRIEVLQPGDDGIMRARGMDAAASLALTPAEAALFNALPKKPIPEPEG